jgi:hypothetical protein
VPSPNKKPEVTQGTALQAARISNDNASPHIFGFSEQQNRSELTAGLARCFRFRWCNQQMVGALKHLATSDPAAFLERFTADLAEEDIWSLQVKPRDTGSPLLLPECSFDVSGAHRDMWRHARSYGDRSNIEGAAKAIRAFERVYL